jgi:hypothetical protein
MEAQANKPGVPGMDREVRHSWTGSSDKSPIITHPQRTGAEPEEDWMWLVPGVLLLSGSKSPTGTE